MTSVPSLTVRGAELPDDLGTIRRLWTAYLTWGNDEMQARHGVHPHSPRETVEQDIASIAKFLPPEGFLALALAGDQPCGIGCLRQIGSGIGEIKRMYVDPSFRRLGTGSAILKCLLNASRDAGHEKVRLDSPHFMTAAHALYRSFGFEEIGAYPESEIPDEFKPYLLFMEKDMGQSDGRR